MDSFLDRPSKYWLPLHIMIPFCITKTGKITTGYTVASPRKPTFFCFQESVVADEIS